jgi:hypothetical protein
MTQLKLFTLVGVANLLFEVSPELLYGAGHNCGHLPDTTVVASSIEEFRANLKQQVSHANQCK